MIQIKNLNKIFHTNNQNQFHALKDITFNVDKNEFVLLSGVSGSGKSTLLAIIASLLKPTSGEIIVNHKQIAKLPDLHASAYRNHDIGFIFQSFNLFDTLSVEENVAIPLIPTGLKQKEIDKKITKALKLANITHKATTIAKNLSGGEKQRCAIARALVNDPQIILCDEPTANLDKENALKFIEVIKTLKQKGFTILIATHDSIFENLHEVDRIIHINDGKII